MYKAKVSLIFWTSTYHAFTANCICEIRHISTIIKMGSSRHGFEPRAAE